MSDDQRLRAVYETHLTAIYRFIYSKVGNREEAEDLTSQVFLKALRDLDQERDPQTIQNWLFQVARTTVADHWRAFYRLHARSLDDLLEAGWEGPSTDDDLAALTESGEIGRGAPIGPEGAPLATVPAMQSAQAMERANIRAALSYTPEVGERMTPAEALAQEILAALPPRYREVLTCRFLLNYSLKETAARMNLSEANIKVLQFRALKKANQIAQSTQSSRTSSTAQHAQSQPAGLTHRESAQ